MSGISGGLIKNTCQPTASAPAGIADQRHTHDMAVKPDRRRRVHMGCTFQTSLSPGGDTAPAVIAGALRRVVELRATGFELVPPGQAELATPQSGREVVSIRNPEASTTTMREVSHAT